MLVLSLLQAAGNLLARFQKAFGNEHVAVAQTWKCSLGFLVQSAYYRMRHLGLCLPSSARLLADGAKYLGLFLLSDHQALASALVVQMSEPRW